MVLKLVLTNPDGSEEVLASGPVQQPLQWKAPPNQPLIVERGGDNGAYKIWCLTVTPIAVLEMQYGKQINPNYVKVF